METQNVNGINKHPSRVIRNIWLWTVLFVIAIVIAMAYRHTTLNNFKAQKIRSEYTGVLHSKENKCRQLTKEISRILFDSTANITELFLPGMVQIPEDVSLFVYRSDTLQFWSDFSTPAPLIYPETGISEGIQHTDNGWYAVVTETADNLNIVGMFLIKKDYLYQNRHLRNNFAHGFNLPNEVEISPEPGEINIHFANGQFLHSLRIPSGISLSETQSGILFLMLFLAYTFLLIALYHSHHFLFCRHNRKTLFLGGYIIDIVLLISLIHYFRVPAFLFDLPLFSPSIVSSSFFFPSLGAGILNSVTVLAASISLYIHAGQRPVFFNRISYPFKSILISFLIVLLYHNVHTLITGLIIDSSISFDLKAVSEISFYSICGFLTIFFFLFSFFLITFPLLTSLFGDQPNSRSLFLLLLFAIIFGCYVVCYSIHPLHFIFLFLFIFPFVPHFFQKIAFKKFATILYYLLLFSLFSTLLLHFNNDIKEKNNRKLLAFNLARERDPLAEFKFADIVSEIRTDTILSGLVSSSVFSPELDPVISKYLKKQYFTGFWRRFDVLVTVCNQHRILRLAPEDFLIDCWTYFRDIIDNNGVPTFCEDLFFIDYPLGPDNYIAIIPFQTNGEPVKIYIELYSIDIPLGPGYPELLIDEESKRTALLSEYSMAKYVGEELVYHFGKYFYNMHLDQYLIEDEVLGYFNAGDYNHFYYQSENKTILISKKIPGFFEKIAPFSYLFLFFAASLFVCMLLFNVPKEIHFRDVNIRKKLQISMVSLIVASFIIIGSSSIIYIIRLNNNKNLDILSEKAHSVLVELEHKLASEDNLNSSIQEYLESLLYKFSLVFFSDINLYDLNGTLLAGSRPEIFSKGFVSQKMNPVAYERMLISNKSLFIHSECIGRYRYLSAYLPFRNQDNKLIAILNLPYFARQGELTFEISAFLVALVNIYLILIVITILVALLVSNYVTKPLQVIREKIGRLHLGKTNEKIEWPKNDEISNLVEEYNRMVEELEKSATLLAQKERESAWREMAKQVAHEIKNPLTPMKLSIQHLKKAWEDKAPDWEQRLEKFTKSLITQIDSLSLIASEFSHFAKMPPSVKRKTDVAEIVRKAVDLFRDTTQIQMTVRFAPDEHYFVVADQEQLLRVLINLLKNAIQAIPDPQTGIIDISVTSIADSIQIIIKDNGVGIPTDQQEKVFAPNFTTKTSGMGLGLAIAKSIISGFGGSIYFESYSNEGTTFFIHLPISDHIL